MRDGKIFNSIPQPVQDAEVFSYHLQRCINSGLWLPNAKEAEEKKAAEAKKTKEASTT